MPSASSQGVIVDRLMMINMAVTDMDKAKEFYTVKLGFKATQDYRQGSQRWVALAVPGGGTSINLATVFENLKPGTMKLYFSTPDIEVAWNAMKAAGVTPTHEISKDSWVGSPWAAWFSVADPDGNQLMIVQLHSPQR